MMKKASTGDTVGTNRRERSLTRNLILDASLGTGGGIKKDECSEKFRKGGDIISIQKLMLQLLDL